MSSKPEPPPEAVLLRLARMACGIRTPVAAEAAGISKARLSQIENGYEKRGGEYRPVSGSDAVIAHLAALTGVTPAELAKAGRPVAADVLRVILARRQQEPRSVTDLRPAVVRDNEDDPVIGPYVRKLWALDVPEAMRLTLIEDIAEIREKYRNGPPGSGAVAVR